MMFKAWESSHPFYPYRLLVPMEGFILSSDVRFQNGGGAPGGGEPGGTGEGEAGSGGMEHEEAPGGTEAGVSKNVSLDDVFAGWKAGAKFTVIQPPVPPTPPVEKPSLLSRAGKWVNDTINSLLPSVPGGVFILAGKRGIETVAGGTFGEFITGGKQEGLSYTSPEPIQKDITNLALEREKTGLDSGGEFETLDQAVMGNAINSIPSKSIIPSEGVMPSIIQSEKYLTDILNQLQTSMGITPTGVTPTENLPSLAISEEQKFDWTPFLIGGGILGAIIVYKKWS